MNENLSNAVTVVASRVMRLCVRALVWANSDKIDNPAEGVERITEQDIAQRTVSIMTAASGVNTAHDDGEECAPFHRVLEQTIREAVGSPPEAAMVVMNLASVIGQTLDPEDIQHMAMHLAVDTTFND